MAELTDKEKEGYAVGVELFLHFRVVFILLHFLWFNYEIVVKVAVINKFIFPFLWKGKLINQNTQML